MVLKINVYILGKTKEIESMINLVEKEGDIMKTIEVNGIKYNVFGKNESNKEKQPHIEIASSGEIPHGKQRGILKVYLIGKGIKIIDTATTHWCVNKVLRSDDKYHKVASEETSSSKKVDTINHLPLTEKNIEDYHKKVKENKIYGRESTLIHDILNTYPKNNDINIIALKIALIDVTNSTSLSKYKSKLSLYDIAKFISEIPDFDLRLSNGDLDLVGIIARNNNIINLFSFASKYCTYHNVEIYKRDDYSIFDSNVKKLLPCYLSNVTTSNIDQWRKTYNYKAFNKCIGDLLDENKINIPFRRRKLDHFLWYSRK